MTTLIREKEILDTITKLNFLATIRSGEKIDVRNMSANEDTILNKIYRSFSGQNRQTTLRFIKETFLDAESLISSCRQTTYFDMLITSMKKAKLGCSNLSNTYSSDRMFLSALQTFLETIDMKLKVLFPEENNMDIDRL